MQYVSKRKGSVVIFVGLSTFYNSQHEFLSIGRFLDPGVKLLRRRMMPSYVFSPFFLLRIGHQSLCAHAFGSICAVACLRADEHSISI